MIFVRYLCVSLPTSFERSGFETEKDSSFILQDFKNLFTLNSRSCSAIVLLLHKNFGLLGTFFALLETAA